MPVHPGKDADGPYYQWGHHGKKYHFTPNNAASRAAAMRKAEAQGQAAYAHGYKG